MTEDLWAERETSPGAIEAALRDLISRRHAQNEAYVPARVLNLVAVVDREWRGEVANRLERVGRYHPSRTVLCVVERGRSTLDARALCAYDTDPKPGTVGVVREQVEIDIGPGHLPLLDTIVAPILVNELITVVWSPHGHPEAVDSLMAHAQVVLLDSVEDPDVGAALSRVSELAARSYVVDLAWLRTTPWRERLAATFDPPTFRSALGQISAVTIRHRPDSVAAGLLLLGWLCSRLGWDPAAMVTSDGNLQCRARGRHQEVALRLDSEPLQTVPGLAGVTVEAASGLSLSLDRGPGGLSARRRSHEGHESTWTVLGASRGEGGILGEGVRQALLRDRTYRPALDAARGMLA